MVSGSDELFWKQPYLFLFCFQDKPEKGNERTWCGNDRSDRADRNPPFFFSPGTSSIVDEKTHEPLLSNLTLIVETAVKLRKDGHKVIIVSSGAIGVGLQRMDQERRPKHLSQLQALAAIGQCRLMSLWDSLFNHLRQPIAQILLTRSDIADVSEPLSGMDHLIHTRPSLRRVSRRTAFKIFERPEHNV